MIHAAIRDLVHRRRRYLISMIGCGLVFAMSLVMTGLADAFAVEWRDSVEAVGAEAFIVPEGISGPFTGANPFPDEDVPSGAEPMVFGIQMASSSSASKGDGARATAMWGVEPGGPLEPSVGSGRQLERSGDVLMSDRNPTAIGSTITIAGEQFEVVGKIPGFSVSGGMAGAVATIDDARDVVFGGLPLVSAAAVPRGSPVPDPSADLRVVYADDAVEDALGLLASARSSIGFMRTLLWGVAALIVASVVFLSVIERLRDFAVFKAIGTSTRDIALGVMLQSTLFAVGSALIGVALGSLIAPLFPMPVAISGLAMLGLPLLGLVVGVLASLFGLNRALRVEPALAFGSAA